MQSQKKATIFVGLLLAAMGTALHAADAGAAPKFAHSFLALGNETYIVDQTGKVAWTYPLGDARRLCFAQRKHPVGHH